MAGNIFSQIIPLTAAMGRKLHIPQIRTRSAPSLIEPLSLRELDVLELLAQRLQNKEIATRLSVSAVTVKAHLRNIFLKIQVSKRQDAVKEAVRIGLLPDELSGSFP